MESASGRAGRVERMFSRIAPRYDLLNTVLSLGQDRAWRFEAAREALAAGAVSVLDAATGTGELALTIKRRSPRTKVTGLDFAEPMLEVARLKAQREGVELDLMQGDVLQLPFESGSFDAVTIAYGLRNLSDLGAGLAEMHRVLRAGGRLVILEFPPPPEGSFGRVFRFYFSNILPRIGGLVSGSREAYEYLPESVLAFPRPPELAARMQQVGFRSVRFRLQTSGISAIFVGERQ